MTEKSDASIQIEFSEEQQQYMAKTTGRGLPSLEMTRLDLAKLVLSAVAVGSQTLPISNSMETRKRILLSQQAEAQSTDLFFMTMPLTDEQKALVKEATGKELSSMTIAPDEWPFNYRENWQEVTGPMHIGDSIVIVIGSNDTQQFAPTDRVITLSPEGAAPKVFGAGRHPTTQLCLVFLERYVQPGDNVLDLGTGSGILAVAAARLGARSVLALDTEAPAVESARATVALNDLSSVVQVGQGSIDAATSAPYDLIVANIFPHITISIASELWSAVRPGGLLITSGIVTARVEQVINALCEVGFTVEKQRSHLGWEAVALRKA